MLDVNCVLRSGASNLTANELTPTGVDFGGPDLAPQTYMVHVPAVSGTTPTLTVVIQESDDNATWRNVLTFETISADGQYFVTGKCNARHRRYTATLTGTTPNFGATIIAPVPGGRYTAW